MTELDTRTIVALAKQQREHESILTACLVTLNSAKWNTENGKPEPALVRIEVVREMLIEALEQRSQSSTGVKDLRMNLWLDPECADRGACQSLVFQHRCEQAQAEALVLGSTVQQVENALEGAHDLGGPLHERIQKLVEQRVPNKYAELLTPENLAAWIPSVMTADEKVASRVVTEKQWSEMEAKAKLADEWFENVNFLLQKCPYTIRDMSGDYTSSRAEEYLIGSLSITFLGMQADVKALKEQVASAPTPPSGKLIIPDGWKLVKQDRLEAISKAAVDPSKPAYRGRGIYHEDIVHGNWSACRQHLDTIKDEVEAIVQGWDEEDWVDLSSPVTKSNDLFQQWYQHTLGHSVEYLGRMSTGQYMYAETRAAWNGWDAAIKTAYGKS